MTPLIETAKGEIRKIFNNELACENETVASIKGFVIFSRVITLEGANKAQGKTCTAHIAYAIHTKDGYWEQVAAHCTEWR